MNCGLNPNTFRYELLTKVFSSSYKPIIYWKDRDGFIDNSNDRWIKDSQLCKKVTLLNKIANIKRRDYDFNTKYISNGYLDIEDYFNELKKQKYINSFKHK